jgi:hypothetical protein
MSAVKQSAVSHAIADPLPPQTSHGILGPTHSKLTHFSAVWPLSCLAVVPVKPHRHVA